MVEFREQGFLPEALNNYLLRLGWGHGDAEVLSRDEQIRLFDLDGVGRSASRMDYVKLTHLNGVWLRDADDDRLTGDVLARLAGTPTAWCWTTPPRARIRAADAGLEGAREDAGRAGRSAAFLARSVPLPFEPKAQPRC